MIPIAPPWLTMIWANKRIIAEIVAIVAIVALVYYYGIHNPKVIAGQRQEIATLKLQVEAGERAVQLLSDIQKGKVKIDERVKKEIADLQQVVLPTNGVFLPGGMLPGHKAMPPATK